jgi:H+/Cl- antiporter ClcA
MLDLHLTEQVSLLNVLTEEKAAVVSGGTLALADSQVLQGRSFRRWTGSVPAGGSLRVTLPGRLRAPDWVLPVLVIPLVLVLAGAAWYVATRQRGASESSPDELLDALAALDARYLGRDGETSADEWSSYQSERVRLKERLERSLASRGRNR